MMRQTPSLRLSPELLWIIVSIIKNAHANIEKKKEKSDLFPLKHFSVSFHLRNIVKNFLRCGKGNLIHKGEIVDQLNILSV